MNDPLDKLEQIFRDEPDLKASPQRKQAAISAAMSAFEEKKSESHQGKQADSRLKEQHNNNVVLETLSRWRDAMKMKYLLPGVAAVATIALVAVNTYQFEALYTPETPSELESLVQAQDSSSTENLLEEQLSRSLVEAKRKAELQGRAVMQQEMASAPAAPAPAPQKLVKAMARVRAPYESYAVLPEFAAVTADSYGLSFPVDPEAYPDTLSESGDQFEKFEANRLKLTRDNPVSTFSIDVDTASYSYLRSILNSGQLPPAEAIRIEELINYFPYAYPVPASRDTPFSLNTTVIPTPWNENTKLLHIGIKGYELINMRKPQANLVFLLDTSGSMNQPNKLPLLISSFKLLLSTLADDDTVSIVSYAGSAGMVLEPTSAKNKAAIMSALEQLRAGGSTAGGEGIELAYRLAKEHYKPKGINRVILATDGDFNVGISDPEALKQYIQDKRDSGIFLSVLGFGRGNYNDALMQALAQNGNGNAAYIDTLSEARKVLVEEASSTLFPIAKDVKIQIEFNPALISEYRLIGYETRQLKREDFNNDKVDAGDIGAGHTVTALYEITPVGSKANRVDSLRYKDNATVQAASSNTEYGYLKVRYKLPDETQSRLIEKSISAADELGDIQQASDDIRFSSAVAAFGQLLSNKTYLEEYGYDDIITLAIGAKGTDNYGYRNEFISLLRLSKSIDQ